MLGGAKTGGPTTVPNQHVGRSGFATHVGGTISRSQRLQYPPGNLDINAARSQVGVTVVSLIVVVEPSWCRVRGFRVGVLRVWGLGIWGFRNSGVWGFGVLRVWGFGDLGVSEFGGFGFLVSQHNQSIQIKSNQIKSNSSTLDPKP